MILRALVDLAESEGLTADLDYQPMPVRWVVTIDVEGRMLGEMADTQRPAADGKGRPTVAEYSIPNRSPRTAGDACEFVVDKAEYVFGHFNESWVKEKTEEARVKKLKDRQVRAGRRRPLYLAEVRLAAERTDDAGLKALARFLERPPPAVPADLGEGDLIAFKFSGDKEVRLITDRPAVREYWKQRRREAERGSGKPPATTPHDAPKAAAGVPCLITGVDCQPVRLHPKIKGIPPLADTKGGVQLTSVNQNAFESYGLDEYGCAPVAQHAADAYEKALNRLLANKRRCCRLSHNAAVVFWSKGDGGIVDLFSDAVDGGDPEAVRALYESVWKGSEIRLGDVSPFYCLTLTGAIGRGTVRGWNETTLGKAIENLRAYFSDLDIVRPADEKRPLLGSSRWPGILNLLAVQNKEENLLPNLAGQVFASILTGGPFPRGILSSAIQRVRVESTEEIIRFHEHKRFALIKAYLCRARRAGDTTIPEVKPMLDEDCSAPAYRLGRLFAVLEKVQDDAIKANATIRDRFYGAASATPVVVFPQLMRKLPHHLGKLPDGSVKFYERLIQQITGGLQPPTPFPHTLRLEEQGLFAVGYYHQRQALFTKRERPAEATSETTTN